MKTIQEFLEVATEYSYAQYKVEFRIDGKVKGWTLFSLNTSYEYKARFVNAQIRGRKTRLVEVRVDDDRFYVDRPCDLVEVLCN